MMDVLVFNLKAVPDLDAGRRLYGNPEEMAQLGDEHVARVMALACRRESDGRTEELPPHLQRIVAIAGVQRHADGLEIYSTNVPEAPESELLQSFFARLRPAPILVSWDGRRTLPVLHYRALLYSLNAREYWEAEHLDLQERFSTGYAEAAVPLAQIAALLGFPPITENNGQPMWNTWLEQGIVPLRLACEREGVTAYLLYLRFERMRGRLTTAEYTLELEKLRTRLQEKPHLQAFAKVCRAPAAK